MNEWTRTANCLHHADGRWVIERIERPDGGLNYCVWDELEMELVAVKQSAEKAMECVK